MLSYEGFNVSTVGFAVAGLDDDEEYYFKVKTIGSNGLESDFSEVIYTANPVDYIDDPDPPGDDGDDGDEGGGGCFLSLIRSFKFKTLTLEFYLIF